MLKPSSRLIVGATVLPTAAAATTTAMTILIVVTGADEDTAAAVRAASPTALWQICVVTSGRRNRPWLATVLAVSMSLPADQSYSRRRPRIGAQVSLFVTVRRWRCSFRRRSGIVSSDHRLGMLTRRS